MNKVLSLWILFQPLYLGIAGASSIFIGLTISIIFFTNLFRDGLKISGKIFKSEILLFALFISVIANQAHHSSSINFPEKYYLFYAYLVLFLLILRIKNIEYKLLPSARESQILLFIFTVYICLSILLGEPNNVGRYPLLGSTIDTINNIPIIIAAITIPLLFKPRFNFLKILPFSFAIFLTKTRSAFLYLFALLATRLHFFPLFFLFFLLLSIFFTLDPSLLGRIMLLASFDAGDARFIWYLIFFECFINDPLFGCGFGTQNEIRQDSHNFFLESLFEGGAIVGLIYFTIILKGFYTLIFRLKFFQTMRNNYDIFYWGWLFILFFLQSLVSNSFLMWPFIFINFCILHRLNEKKHSSTINKIL